MKASLPNIRTSTHLELLLHLPPIFSRKITPMAQQLLADTQSNAIVAAHGRLQAAATKAERPKSTLTQWGMAMRILRRLASLIIGVLALGLMGQAQNCSDVKDLTGRLDGIFSPKNPDSKIHISNLSFMDTDTKSVLPSGDAELLNQAVDDAMRKLSISDPKYVINEFGRTLVNNDTNAKKLNDIIWDPNLSRSDKVDKIISELMEPAGIDGLVAGQYQEKSDGSIILRPFVISRSPKNIVMESRAFKREEFNCKDPENPKKNVLCAKTVEDLKDSVIRLIKQL